MAGRSSAKPSGDQAGLSREQVVAAALEYIDTHGLESFSMRNLAKELGVYPTALYWHAGNRDALLTDITAQVLVEILPPDDVGDWEHWVCEYGRRFRAALHAHPNLAPVVTSNIVTKSSAEIAIVELLLGKLHEAGFRDEALVDAYNVVVGCAVGFVSLELAVRPESGDGWSADLAHRMATLDPAQFPVLAANKERLANRAFALRWLSADEAPIDTGFEAMLRVVVTGLRARLESQHL